MQQKTLLFFLIFFIGISSKTFAQTADQYGFQALSGSFTEITGTTIPSLTIDDALVQGIPIGFTFNYCGVNYTQVCVHTNGFLSFNTGLTEIYANQNQDNSFELSKIKPALLWMWEDLTGDPGTASYLTTGTAPNRVFTVQYKNWGWDYLATSPVLSVQVKIYETTNVIEYIYRQESGSILTGSGGATIGLADNATPTSTWKVLNNTSTSPTASSTNYVFNILTKPATGQIYRWTPPAPCNTITSGWPATGSVTLSNSESCVLDSIIATFTPIGNVPASTGTSYSWWHGPTPTGPWTLVGTSTTNSRKVAPGASAYIRGAMMCGNTILVEGVSPLLTVNAPAAPTNIVNGYNCGSGTVNLSATGNNLKWFAAPTGGLSIGSGSSFTTPSLSATTTFYVSSTVGASAPPPTWVGTGTGTFTGPNSPYYTTWYGNKNQYLIRASELTALGFNAGNIISLGFDLLGKTTTYNLTNYYIAMKNTSTTSLTSWEAGTTPVYNHPSYNMVANTINTHVFQTPFAWDGSSNLLIEICFNNTGWGGSQTVRYTTGYSYNTSLNYYNDLSNVCTAPGSPSAYTSRPNMRIHMESGCASVRMPALASSYNPVAAITTGNIQPLCQGDSIMLSAAANALNSYQWLLNNFPIPGATSSNYYAKTGGAYRVVVTQGGTCHDTSAAKNVVVYQMPAPGLSYVGDLKFCEGGSVVLAAIAVPDVSYQWFKNGFPIGGATDSTYEAKTSGNYSVRISSATGCAYSSHSVSVTVYPNPTPPIVRNGLVLSTSVYSSYQWFRNNAPIPGANAQSYTISQIGAYLVEVVTPDLCINRSPINTITSLSTSTVANNKSFKLYPNPTQNKVIVEAPEAVNVAVQTVTGQTLMNLRNVKEVDLSSLASGMYFFVLTNDQDEFIGREKITKIQ